MISSTDSTPVDNAKCVDGAAFFFPTLLSHELCVRVSPSTNCLWCLLCVLGAASGSGSSTPSSSSSSCYSSNHLLEGRSTVCFVGYATFMMPCKFLRIQSISRQKFQSPLPDMLLSSPHLDLRQLYLPCLVDSSKLLLLDAQCRPRTLAWAPHMSISVRARKPDRKPECKLEAGIRCLLGRR